MDKILGKLASKREHLNLPKQSKELKRKLEQLDRQREKIARVFREIDVEMVYKNYDLHQALNYRVKVLSNLEFVVCNPCLHE